MTVRKLRIIEFIIIGLVANSLDNIIAIRFAAGASLTPAVLAKLFLFVIPFAILSELIVDHPNFWKRIMKFLKIEIKQIEKKI
ncbi:MAG: hypothetical protein HY451_01885 [Parcubacteria group bacterium]|nr:hypothetical protein [Parcubacteria group bacterium]